MRVVQRSAFASGWQEAFFEGHEHAFRVLGGVLAGQIRYDDLKAAVAQAISGGCQPFINAASLRARPRDGTRPARCIEPTSAGCTAGRRTPRGSGRPWAR
jgi:hypothetical protein